MTLVLKIFQWLPAAHRLESKHIAYMIPVYQSEHISYPCFPHPCPTGHPRAFVHATLSVWNIFAHVLDFRSKTKAQYMTSESPLDSLSKVDTSQPFCITLLLSTFPPHYL